MADLSYSLVIRDLKPADGGGYIVQVPDLPGCMADGETVEEAVAEAQSAIAEWIDEANRLGRDVPKPGDAVRRGRAHRDALCKLIEKQDEVLKAKDDALKATEAALEELRTELNELRERESELDPFSHLCVVHNMRTALSSLKSRNTSDDTPNSVEFVRTH